MPGNCLGKHQHAVQSAPLRPAHGLWLQEFNGRFNLNGSDLPYAALWGEVSTWRPCYLAHPPVACAAVACRGFPQNGCMSGLALTCKRLQM